MLYGRVWPQMAVVQMNDLVSLSDNLPNDCKLPGNTRPSAVSQMKIEANAKSSLVTRSGLICHCVTFFLPV